MNTLQRKDQIGAKTQLFNDNGDSQWVKSGGGVPKGWYHQDPTLNVVESLPEPEVETHEITEDEMPSHGEPDEPMAA